VFEAIVIGNGESRRHLDLNLLKNKYTLIGCNAIHRDVVVDHLICCDRRMVDEAVENPNTSKTNIYVRGEWFKYFRKIKKYKNISAVPALPYQGTLKKDLPDHWGSGCYAVLIAASMFDTVKLIGFDLYSKNKKINNIYKGTNNYLEAEAKPVDPSYWTYQLGKIFGYFPNVNFIVFNEGGWQMPQEWKTANISFENIEQLTC
jgi:hypothetical protein